MSLPPELLGLSPFQCLCRGLWRLLFSLTSGAPTGGNRCGIASVKGMNFNGREQTNDFTVYLPISLFLPFHVSFHLFGPLLSFFMTVLLAGLHRTHNRLPPHQHAEKGRKNGSPQLALLLFCLRLVPFLFDVTWLHPGEECLMLSKHFHIPYLFTVSSPLGPWVRC